MEQVVLNPSLEPAQRMTLPDLSWETIVEPGAYVEKGTGDLYRIPKEALNLGETPTAVKESRGMSRLIQLSKNPFITTLEARMLCAQHNVHPNF